MLPYLPTIFCLLEGNLLNYVSAWSSWTPGDGSVIGPLADRRTAMARIGAFSAVLAGVMGPGAALANTAELTELPAFDAYSIIPDAGIKLDPKLEKVDVRVCDLGQNRVTHIECQLL